MYFSNSSSKLSPVERERLRERDREARVKMNHEAEQRASQDAFSSPPLFGEIVRVKSNDKVRKQIEGKLGRFDEVKHLLDQDLYGIDGQPPPSPAPSGGSSSSCSTMNAHEFKKPNACSQIQPIRSSSHHHHHSSSQRSGNIKPADGKPAYGGRGFYPGQPVTTSSISNNAFRSSGMVPGKGPPSSSSSLAAQSGNGSSNSSSGNSGNSNGSSSISSGSNTNSNSSNGGSNSISSHHGNNSSSSSNSSRSSTSHEFSSKLHASARNLPKLNCEPREPLLSSTLSTNSSSGGSQANVENILDEMTSAVRTPLTAIAATPRPKESESKFTFNPVSGKVESLTPIKAPAADKNSRANLLKEILAPVSQVPISASVFKTGKLDNPITPLTSPSNSPATDSSTIAPSKSKSSISANSASTVSTAVTSSSKTASTNLPYNVKNVILSEEDSEDDDDNDDDDDSEEESNSRKSAPSELSKNVEPAAPVALENSTNKPGMPVEEDRASSSSDDSEESDSGSDSEDSSSDSPPPPSLPAPELPSPVDSKKWNRLKNFMLPTAHGNLSPTPQTPQAGENSEKSKTDDSDSSTQKSQNASSSSSDSDAESVKSSRDKPSSKNGRKVISNLSSDDSSDDDDDDDDKGSKKQTRSHRNRRNHQRRPSSATSCSSDDSDNEQQQQQRKKKLLKGQQSAATPKPIGAPANSGASNSGATTGGSNPNVNNPNMTVVGVVRPHQRRPPSPPSYESTCRLSPQTSAEDRYGSYVQQQQQQQRSLSMSTASELPSHTDSDSIMGRVGGHSRLSNAFQAQHPAAAAASAVRGGKAPVSADKAGPVANPLTKSNKGRKPKSPAMASADSATRVKKKPGRKRTKMPELSDSEDDEQRKIKVPERKRPGRPPLKRVNPDDVEWNAGSRKKMLEKFPANNMWSDSQRRRSSLRNFPHIDSDSDEQQPPKPTARVIPAIYKKESSGSGSSTIGGGGGGCSSRVNRDSSCDSAPNDNDYGSSLLVGSGAKNGGASAGTPNHHLSSQNVTKAEDSPPKLVVGNPVHDKRKTQTLRKLFVRPQEGGGKGGGKGKGGKGKCGVIVMESETERKMLQRSMSPASSSTGSTTPGSIHRLGDRLADIPRDSLTFSSPLQRSPMQRSPMQRSPRVGCGALSASAKSGCGSSRRQEHRVPEMDSPNVTATPTTPSTSVDPPIALPILAYNEQGRPSLMCKIDLSRIPYIVAKKRSEEMRIRSDLPDTRQQLQREQQQPAAPPPVVDIPPSSAVSPDLDMVNVPVIEPLSNGEENDAIDRTGCSSNNSLNSSSNVGCIGNNGSATTSSSRTKRLTAKKSKTAKRKHHARDESPAPSPSSLPPPIFKPSSSAAHTPSVEPQSDSSSSDSEPRKKGKSQRLIGRTANDSIHNLMSPCYQLPINTASQNSMGVDHGSDEESWRSDVSSCISCSSPPLPLYGNHSKRPSKNNHLTSRSWNKRRSEHSQRHTSLNDATASLLNVPGGSYDRSIPDPTLNAFQIADLVRPVVPTHHGIYYSYLEHKASEEINSESDTVSPNVYLSEAKKLKYAADMERDRVAQGMKYLEAILSFLLTGHVLERKNQMETAFSMYSETLKVIVYISSRFRQLSANSPPSSIPNKIAVLSLRCESILNLKLFTMRDMNSREIHNTVNDYFNKPGPVEQCVVPNQNIPSSPTPSPASSVGSNSSGYSSSGDRRTSAMTQCIMVPVPVHVAIQKQHDLFTNLLSSFTYWEEADKLIFSGGSKDFFIELDRFCGPLTLHSSLKDLVHYVRVGIQRLKAIISHHQRV